MEIWVGPGQYGPGVDRRVRGGCSSTAERSVLHHRCVVWFKSHHPHSYKDVLLIRE